MEVIKMNVMVKKLMESLDNLEKKDQTKFICYVLDSWDNNLINSSNICNPDLEDTNIEIFNPLLIGYSNNLIKDIKCYLNYNYNLFYRFYQKGIEDVLSNFEKLFYEDKIIFLKELFLFLEQNNLLPDNIDGYIVARKIMNYQSN